MKQFYIGLVLFLLSGSAFSADYEVITGNSTSKLGATGVTCTSGVDANVRTVADGIKEATSIYAVADDTGVDFKFSYPSNVLNSNVRAKVRVFPKGSTTAYTSSSFSTLSSGGATRTLTSTKSYDGQYYLTIVLANQTVDSEVCGVVGGVYIEIRPIQPPSINSVSVSPSSAESGSQFTFSASLSGGLPTAYGMQVDFGAGYKTMSTTNGTDYTYSSVANTVGNNRPYTVKLVDGSGILIESKAGTYTVTTPPETQYSPVLTISSASSAATQGYSYCVSLKATDQNSNLKTLLINWGDDPSNVPDAYSYSSNTGNHTQQMCHTYSLAGLFTWSATVNDHTGKEDSVTKSITVSSNVPDIDTVNVSPTSAVSGSTFTFSVSLSGGLPSGYSMQVDFGAGYKEMANTGGNSYSHSGVASYVDNDRAYTVRMVNSSEIEVASKSGTYTVTTPPGIQYDPTLSIVSASSAATQDSEFCVSLKATDQNANLMNLFINWGDDPSNVPDAYDFGSNTGDHTQQMCHTYTQASSFSWSATVADYTGKEATVTGDVVVSIADPEALPTVTTPTVTQIDDVNSTLQFEVVLSKALPAGYGVFVNFDDQQGEWFIQSTPGGHMALEHQGNGVYSVNYGLVKPGLRSFRAGIFNTLNDADASNDVLIGDYSAKATCFEDVCIDAITQVSGYGNPAITGSGSQLFKQVDVANGNYHLAVTDISVPGKGPSFAFSRAYNSMSEASKQWTFAYEMKATFIENTFNRKIAIGPREDGHMQHFFKDMNEDGGQWYSLNPGNFDQLIENSDGSFVLYTQGNRLYRFENPIGGMLGRLKSIDDRSGNALVLSYANNALVGATDSNNRSYVITRENGRIKRVSDFSGRYVEYGYDSNGMVTSVRNVGEGIDRYSYVGASGDDRYCLSTIKDPRENLQTSIGYDANGRVANVTDGLNHKTSFSYSVDSVSGLPFTGVTQPTTNGINNNRAYLLDEFRSRVEVMFDSLSTDNIRTRQEYKKVSDRKSLAEKSLVTRVVQANDSTTDITYSSVGAGKPHKITDALERDITATYADLSDQQPNLTPLTALRQPGITLATKYTAFTDIGQATEIVDAKNNKATRAFNAQGWLTSSSDARQNATQFSHDEFGNVTEVKDALDNVTKREFDTLGRIIKETSPAGLVTSYTYDASGNVLTRIEAAQGFSYTTRYDYDESHNLISVTDPRNHQTTYVYDKLNRKTEEKYTVNGVQHSKRYEYDALGRLASITDERNQTSSTRYNARDHVTSVINPLNITTTSYTYDVNDNVKTVTDAEDRTITYEYDLLNRKTKATDDEGNFEAWTYNEAGQVKTYRDRRGEVTQYEYDALGNITKLYYPDHPELGFTENKYDANGNVIQVIDPNSNKTTYTYDALNRRVSTILNNGQSWVYTYDANGNQLTETTPTGEVTEQLYDPLNRVTQLTEKAANGEVLRKLAYSYDANGNVLEVRDELQASANSMGYTYDEIDRITSVTDQYGKTIGYGYDKAGNRTTLVYPGNKTVTYTFDDAGHLKTLTDWLDETTTYSRNDAGQPTKVVNGNGTQTDYVYDLSGRLTSLTNKTSTGAVISQHSMTLDEQGNITKVDGQWPLQPDLSKGTTLMSFDDNNRILSAAGSSYAHDSSGRVVEEDAAGNETSYVFNINDLISSISKNGVVEMRYGYDLNNSRISQVLNGVETRYVVDPLASLPNVVAETNAQGAITHYYLYGEGLVSQISAANESHYYHFDPTGHTLALTDASGEISDRYAYTPFGETTSQGSSHNPFQYVGKHGVMDDGNGLHYMRARYYKKGIKRFMSLDALHGDIVNPQALNRYAYVLGNPVRGVDPSGLTEVTSGEVASTGMSLFIEGIKQSMLNLKVPVVSFKADVVTGQIIYRLGEAKAFTEEASELGNKGLVTILTGVTTALSTYEGCSKNIRSIKCLTAIEKAWASNMVGLGVGWACLPAGPYAAVVCSAVAAKTTNETLDVINAWAWDLGVYKHKWDEFVRKHGQKTGRASYRGGQIAHQKYKDTSVGKYLDWVILCGYWGGKCN